MLYEVITEVPDLDKKKKHTLDLVVDRLVVRDGLRSRLTDSYNFV